MVTSPSTQSTYSNGYPVTPLMSPVSRHMDPYMIHIQGMMDEFSYMDHSSVQKNLEFSKSPPPSTASVSQYAVQMLQDDVALLAQEIDALRQTIKQRERRRRQLRWTWVRFLKSLVQHAVINSFLAFVIFWCLWRQRSPIAYTIIGYMRPKVKQMLRVIVHSMLH
ncbi:uncharacterized protein BYT42DRAFT_574639 [Radiomyces spectabilis]|uniref:uncharacterized protein n=1 Tax=Radiomyces spectabilis TaxID=64574 RepID=UPI002220864E|nr:uncharacterized protein BYT42DRAFT_574639 [Radiomyces spectabilis]KAI8376447.1 hypothetical protein BYT42DRAFT_574639 [Radiomyces spectabilis]